VPAPVWESVPVRAQVRAPAQVSVQVRESALAQR
jgi:hypothetical protein